MGLNFKCTQNKIVTPSSNAITLRSNRARAFLGLPNFRLLIGLPLKSRFIQRMIVFRVGQLIPGGLEKTLRFIGAGHSRGCRRVLNRFMRSSGRISVSQLLTMTSDQTNLAFPGMTVLLAVLSPNSSASTSRILRWLELRYLGIEILNSTHKSPEAFLRPPSFGIP